MDTERRILRSTTILFCAHVVSQLASFGFVILFARSYSPALFGEYTFALSLGAILAVFVSLGINGLLLRKSSQDSTVWRTVAGLVLPGHLLLAIVTWVVAVLVSALLGASGSELRVIGMITAFQLLNPIWTMFAIGFTATERMGYTAIADAGGRILILIAGGVAITMNAPVEFALIVFPISSLFVLVALARLASKEFGRPRLRIDYGAYCAILREALPFLAVVALAVIYTRIGILLLRATSSPGEVGVFASAERLVAAAGMLHATFGQAIFPAMVRIFAEDRHAFSQLVNRCARLALLVSLPLATLLFLFADDVIQILFGDRYRNASLILRLIAWLLALRGVTVILNNVAIATHRQTLVVRSNIYGITTLVLFCVILIPMYGALGLAVAALLAQTAKSLCVFLMLRPSGLAPNIGRMALPIAAACSATILLAISLADASLLIRSSAVFISGISLLYLFRAVRPEDFAYARQVMSTRSRTEPRR